ncbi:MAG TPA: electron transfer flavoprotein subunit beta/FixA family protein [Candidatus Thermoplasmatota archaeon]|nr:electron transfer flavoprotein subunit beta/FixA family protein [Candidatus Thermoplasmatota archaeon]
MPSIAVCIKAVPSDLNIHISRRTGEPALEGVRYIINPWEKRAIEIALKLKEEHGGTVTVVTMDEPHATLALREGLAMGADRAILLHDKVFEGADTLATARVLAAALGKLRPDIVVTGGRTADRRSAQVGPMVAQLLNIPAVTFVTDVRLEGRKLKVKKRFAQKLATYEAPMPCLLSVGEEIGRPRVATAWGVSDAFTKEVAVWNRRDLDLHEESVGREGSPTRVRRLEKIASETRGVEVEMFEGDATDVARAFVRKIRARGWAR